MERNADALEHLAGFLHTLDDSVYFFDGKLTDSNTDETVHVYIDHDAKHAVRVKP